MQNLENNSNYQAFEANLVNKLKKAEEQIIKGEFTSADIVFAELRNKYR